MSYGKRMRQYHGLLPFPCRVKKVTAPLKQWIKDNVILLPKVSHSCCDKHNILWHTVRTTERKVKRWNNVSLSQRSLMKGTRYTSSYFNKELSISTIFHFQSIRIEAKAMHWWLLTMRWRLRAIIESTWRRARSGSNGSTGPELFKFKFLWSNGFH